jgi:alkylation response protein AidB-like acyl-CoA dehydrogenase
MKPLGFSGLTIAEEYGGTGRDIFGGIIVVEELSKRYPALGWLYVMSAFYGGVNIGHNGNEEQKQFFLPKIARGDILFSYALTEPNSGSDAASAQTVATKHNGGFKLNGTKTLITGADQADYILILTRSDPNVAKHKGLTMFIVDKKKVGIEIRPLTKLGYKGSSCCEIVLDEVESSPEDILGGPNSINNGWSQVLATLDVEHLEIAACSVGLAQGAFDEAIKYAKERKQFGQPIGRFQAIQHMFAEMATGIQTARLLLYYTTWLMENDKPCSLESAMAKYYASEVAKHVALQGLQIFGGYGYVMEYDIQRFVRDALVLPIGGGTTQILKNIIAGRLGLTK